MSQRNPWPRILGLISWLFLCACQSPELLQDTPQPITAFHYPTAVQEPPRSPRPTWAPLAPKMPVIPLTPAVTLPQPSPTPQNYPLPTVVPRIQKLDKAPIVTPGTIKGMLAPGEEHWYRFAVPEGAAISLELFTDTRADPMTFALLTPDRTATWAEYDLPAGSHRVVRRLFSQEHGGIHYLGVNRGRGAYTLTLTITPQDDASLGGDAADELNWAPLLDTQLSYTGQVGDLDSADWYRFFVPSGNVLEVHITAQTAGPLSADLVSPNGGVIWSAYHITPTTPEIAHLVLDRSAGGTFALGLAGEGFYTFSLLAAPQEDAFTNGDAADQPQQATFVRPGKIYPGRLGNLDPADWYAIEVPAEHILSVRFTPDPGASPMTVVLLDAGLHEIWAAPHVPAEDTRSVQRVLNRAGSGVFVLGISDGEGTYALEVSTEPQNDAQAGGDAGDTLDQATRIWGNRTLTGQIGEPDRADWYSVEIEAGYKALFEFSPDAQAESMQLGLWDQATATPIWVQGPIIPGTRATTGFLCGSTQGATLGISIQSGSGIYSLAITIASQNDADANQDAPDSADGPLPLATGTYWGEVGEYDMEDWYRFEADEVRRVAIYVDNQANSLDGLVQTDDGTPLWSPYRITPGTVVSYDIADNGETLYLAISGGSGRYRLDLYPR